MKDFYLVISSDGERGKKFEKWREVNEFLKGKSEKDYEILKIRYEYKPPCKRHKSPMFYPRIIWRSGFTDIEHLVFEGLKGLGYKVDEDFVVQYPVEGRMFVLDFAFVKEKLDIECDGEIWHKEYKDEKRDEFLKNKGWEILRFKGKEIKEDLPSVLETIRLKVEELRSNRSLRANLSH